MIENVDLCTCEVYPISESCQLSIRMTCGDRCGFAHPHCCKYIQSHYIVFMPVSEDSHKLFDLLQMQEFGEPTLVTKLVGTHIVT